MKSRTRRGWDRKKFESLIECLRDFSVIVWNEIQTLRKIVAHLSFEHYDTFLHTNYVPFETIITQYDNHTRKREISEKTKGYGETCTGLDFRT